MVELTKLSIMENKKILVFGGSGYLGRAIIDRYGTNNQLLIFSRDEAKHWELHNSIKDRSFQTFIGDIRNKDRVLECIKQFNPECILIVSALKQIPICEIYPSESIQTNIIGVQNIVDACLQCRDIKKCLFISSDKACSPVNVYGMCKAIAEKIMAAASIHSERTKFLTVRYGNVLNSTGSIIPLFKKQCGQKTPITVTNEYMTRYVMTYSDSLDLIDNTLEHGETGDIWIPILPSMQVIHLAEIFSETYNNAITITGIRPGEKIHEELVNTTESHKTNRHNNFYVIKPSFSLHRNNESFNYNSSQEILDKETLKTHILNQNLL